MECGPEMAKHIPDGRIGIDPAKATLEKYEQRWYLIVQAGTEIGMT